MNSPTHMIPVDVARRNALRWALRRVVLVTIYVTAAAALLLSVGHYGDATTANEGWTVGPAGAEIGLETRGDPDIFGYLRTPWGVAGFAGGQAWFCPTGWTDTQCGA